MRIRRLGVVGVSLVFAGACGGYGTEPLGGTGGTGGAGSAGGAGSGSNVQLEPGESAHAGNSVGGAGSGSGVQLEPGVALSVELGESARAAKASLDVKLADIADLDATAFAAQTAVPFEQLAYDPLTAAGLDLIQSSNLGLSDGELSELGARGFVIATRQQFPTFTYGYASIYADDLPLYVSADSILYALHHSYDDVLAAFEKSSLLPALETYSAGMRTQLASSSLAPQTKQDVDVFLSVAAGLLKGEFVAPLDSGVSANAKELFDGCTAGEGAGVTSIFGVERSVDFSQCTPRGHYTNSPELERYFRAMIWLGRIDFRILETQEDHSQLFHRRQLVAALALRELMTPELLEIHQGIDDFVTAFVGEHDYMTVPQLNAYLTDVGAQTVADLDALDDQTLAEAITAGGYGTQRISSHYMVNGLNSGTLPLSASFALFGQRYVIDSHVFSNVVYDRVAGGTVRRMMPDPLDAAYAALGNDQAGMLLAAELEKYTYAPDLAAMRTLVDSEPPAFWEKNLYNRWLGAIRTLSPTSAFSSANSDALPSIARTEPWGRRLLNAQLASWAELRHDTVLYVKQSYTGGATCEFPDAYVEPYPEFFAQIQAYAEHALSVVDNVAFPAPPGAREHFEHFAEVAGTLREMAEHQRTGTPHSAEHLAFINQTVSIQQICGGAFAEGWYPELFFGTDTEFEPTIADVHTQPTDEGGAEVGRVLHVGTGPARLMVTTIETCEGPRAYAGLVSSYFQHVEEDWKRLTDPEWEARVSSAPPAPPAWLGEVLTE